MKAQTKAIVASAVVICLCLCAVSGITYSWFSDTERAEINVNAAKIDIEGVFTEVSKESTASSTVNPAIPGASESDLASVIVKTQGDMLAVDNIMPGVKVTANYQLKNLSTIASNYRMYVVIDETVSRMINSGVIEFKIDGVVGGQNNSANTSVQFNDGVGYYFGSGSNGINLPARATETGDIYNLNVTLVVTPEVTQLDGFTIKIVNEAYQYGYEYKPVIPMKDGTAIIPKPEGNNGYVEPVIIDGTVPNVDVQEEPVQTQVTFPASVLNNISGQGDITLKTEMLPPEGDGSIARIQLSLSGVTETDFGTDNYVTVSVKLKGQYDSVKVEYVGPDADTKSQPILLGSSWDGEYTTVAFKTDHFSEFQISNIEGMATDVFVDNQADLNATIANASEPTVIGLSAGTYNLLMKDGSTPNMVDKDITFVGNKYAKIDFTHLVGDGGNNATWHTQDAGATITFVGITVVWGQDNEGYQGLANAKKVTYKNCTISGTQFMGGDADFIDCIFEAENTTEKGYAVYGRGTGTLTFTGCTFNTDGRAIMLFQDQTTEVTVIMKDCVFKDNGNYTSKPKAVVETGDGQYKTSKFTIVIDNCTAEGFEANGSNSPLWGNKDDIPSDRLSVTINGIVQSISTTV